VQVINDWPEEKLGQIICDYGEERNWRGIAARIIAARPIDTTAQLVKVCIARPSCLHREPRATGASDDG
jgi:16S rRNA (cytosine1402-N4)-methyltransferase